MSTKSDGEIVGEAVEDALCFLAEMFKPECKLTFIMRVPGNDEADMVVTSDENEELAKVIERTIERDSEHEMAKCGYNPETLNDE